jgi:cytochrome P450
MTSTSQDQQPLDRVRVGDREQFKHGPPHELFRRMRSECPVHWSDGITEYPDEDGFWSVTRADDVHEVSRDWQTFSSELGGFTATKKTGLSLEMQQAMFIGMDPPKHDRLKALFQRGFTPTRMRSARSRPACSTAWRVARPAIWSTRWPSRWWRA